MATEQQPATASTPAPNGRGVMLPPEELAIIKERLNKIDDAITAEELLRRLKLRLKEVSSSP